MGRVTSTGYDVHGEGGGGGWGWGLIWGRSEVCVCVWGGGGL